jgi:pSer/pThr/pTyr-binding forkhead associated (FHA) protein
MKLSLLVMTSGKLEGQAIEIKLPQFLVGRDPQCHLRPASALISKRHCALIQREGKAYIRDFGSTNGTFVNDERVEGERELQNDDQLKIGPIHFAVRLDRAATPSKTPAPPTKSPTQIAKVPAAADKAAAGAVRSDTPAPPTQPKKASAEDDIAALLLSLEDGDSSSSSSSADGVPEGSTVFDLPVPSPAEAAAAAAKEAKEDKNKPKAPGDTRSAAANILEKMMKRPRTQQ